MTAVASDVLNTLDWTEEPPYPFSYWQDKTRLREAKLAAVMLWLKLFIWEEARKKYTVKV